MTQAIIAYDTFQNTPGLITEFSTFHQGDAGLPVENMIDYATHTQGQLIESGASFGPVVNWILSASTPANYIGIAAHTIPDGTIISILDFSSGSLVTLGQVITVGTGPQLLKFPATYQTDYYRIRIEVPDNTVINIGSMFLGRALDLPMGIQAPYSPPPLNRDTVLYPSTPNKGSNYLGGHVQRTQWRFDIQQNNLEPAWVNANWLPLARHIEQRPFFYLWDTNRPQDAVYGWVSSKVAPPAYTSALRMAFNLSCSGLHVR